MIVLKDKAHTFLASFGRLRIGKTVQYRLLDSTASEITTWSAVGVQEIGYGMYGVVTTITNALTKYIEFKNVQDDLYVADPITVEDDWVSSLNRIAGLVHENMIIDTTVYDGDGNLTSGRLRIFPSKADLLAETNIIATYTITAVASGVGTFTSWKQVKD